MKSYLEFITEAVQTPKIMKILKKMHDHGARVTVVGSAAAAIHFNVPAKDIDVILDYEGDLENSPYELSNFNSRNEFHNIKIDDELIDVIRDFEGEFGKHVTPDDVMTIKGFDVFTPSALMKFAKDKKKKKEIAQLIVKNKYPLKKLKLDKMDWIVIWSELHPKPSKDDAEQFKKFYNEMK